MPTFSAAGRSWDLKLTYGTVKRVRAETQQDLALIGPDGRFSIVECLMDQCRLADVLWSVVEPQARAAGVTRDQFDDGLDGTAMRSGAVGLLDAVMGFFPLPDVVRELGASGAEVLANLSIEMQAAMRAEKDRLRSGPPTGSDSASNSPGSPASIPTT